MIDNKSLENIVAELATREEAFTVAKQAYEVAQSDAAPLQDDDGTSDPAVLVSLRMDAARKVEIAKVVHDRAKAAFDSFSNESRETLRTACSSIGHQLRAKATDIQTKTIAKIAAAVGAEAGMVIPEHDILPLLHFCQAVRTRKFLADSLNQAGHSNRLLPISHYVEALKPAFELL